MADIGMPGFILLIIVALLLFGPKKLPELGRALGRTVREFKSGMHGLMNDDEPNTKKNTAEYETDRPNSKQQLPE
ncbi:twin-arginine translocase TatA/TatE family subunit [Paenibacillus sp. JDR-2]|uniref:twin-arginine translocase TatA/TatE family subunit n=1 Tax=Paenibacillus sp. (strain JDR-2) TaxID=324057 RepID=UPI0001667B60|nr:twin-arginine translocase TatA/TatE family subunit [Paenibacillus sp. JDR-2]ACT02324.1 twin-arginine translocation protein, TatA/E family subunit [Paenibacillus sp. JDR-2]